jgi:hypothetical protein
MSTPYGHRCRTRHGSERAGRPDIHHGRHFLAMLIHHARQLAGTVGTIAITVIRAAFWTCLMASPRGPHRALARRRRTRHAAVPLLPKTGAATEEEAITATATAALQSDRHHGVASKTCPGAALAALSSRGHHGPRAMAATMALLFFGAAIIRSPRHPAPVFGNLANLRRF